MKFELPEIEKISFISKDAIALIETTDPDTEILGSDEEL